MKHGLNDVQQIATDGSRIVSIHPGPHMVRVHEARDVIATHSANRYYLSVDLKFRPSDALRVDYWFGVTKSEATRAANKLAEDILTAVRAIQAAEASNLRGKELLVERQTARLALLVDRFSRSVESA